MSEAVTLDAAPGVACSEGRTYRKVAIRILSLLLVCYVVAYLDRVNVGIAKLSMSADLGFSEAAYGFGAGLFFVGYLVFEVPSNLIMHRVGARFWLARIMVTWGLISALMAFVSAPWQFYTLRFLLGVAEAGFYPGVILYLTYWFPNSRRAQMTAVFQAGIPLAGLIGSPLSGLIMTAFDRVGGYAGWQWMFVLEALPTLPLALCLYVVLDDRVEDARWLSRQERDLIRAQIAQDDQRREHIPMRSLLADRRIWKVIALGFPAMMGLYTLGFYMPTMIREAGVADATEVGLLSAIPYLAAIVAMIAVGRSSDRCGERRWHLAGVMFAGAAGLVASTLTGHSVPLLVASLSLAAAGIVSFSPLMWTLPTAFLGGATAAAAIGVINSLANLGGFVAPYLVGFARDVLGGGSAAIDGVALALAAGGLIALSFGRAQVAVR